MTDREELAATSSGRRTVTNATRGRAHLLTADRSVTTNQSASSTFSFNPPLEMPARSVKDRLQPSVDVHHRTDTKSSLSTVLNSSTAPATAGQSRKGAILHSGQNVAAQVSGGVRSNSDPEQAGTAAKISTGSTQPILSSGEGKGAEWLAQAGVALHHSTRSSNAEASPCAMPPHLPALSRCAASLISPCGP